MYNYTQTEPLDFATSEATAAINLANEYIKLNGKGSPADKDIYFTYYSNLKVVFYQTLGASPDLNIDILTQVDADYKTTDDADPEVKQRWLPAGLILGYTPAFEASHTWVSSMGRCKYLTPIYVALEGSGQHDLGVTWYNENLDFYHPVAITTVARDLNLPPASKRIEFIE
jgi:leukotriene-A4 hydrolase